MGTSSLQVLIEALRALPGVGLRSATRMAHHLLQRDPAAALQLARALQTAVERMRHCERCHTLTEAALCALCQDPERDGKQLCVVETAADQMAIERSGGYRGLYFVLLGRLSPLDGVQPHDIGLQELKTRACDGVVQEVVLATNFTAEGELTAHAIEQMLKPQGLRVTRLARGVPAGSELEYVDLSTLAHALHDRR